MKDHHEMDWDELDLEYARKRGKAAEAKVKELEVTNWRYLSERQQLRELLRVRALPRDDGTYIADFDPQPPLVDAAKHFVDRVKELEEQLWALSDKYEKAEIKCCLRQCSFLIAEEKRVKELEDVRGMNETS